mgnify:CR=1 FL=1
MLNLKGQTLRVYALAGLLVMLKKPKQAKLFAIVDRLVALAETGSVVFAHYTDVVEHWQNDYNAVSNIVPMDELDPATFTCR